MTGQVDLVKQPNYGIGCQDGGSCVDLDGTAGPGAMESSAVHFGTGQVTVSFDLSGNQRRDETDPFRFNLVFVNPVPLTAFTTTSGFPGSPANIGDFPAGLFNFSYETVLGQNDPWTHYSLTFNAQQGGALKLNFSTTSADNVGPLVDNALVTGSATPEPAAWALMIGGFGLAGAALRRRRAVAATA